jgi:hypothetical protein
MNKLAFLLVAATALCFGGGQESNKEQAATVSPAKRTQQAGPLEITAVDAEYKAWGWQNVSFPRGYVSITGWGVRVHVVNTTDQRVSEYAGPEGLEMTSDSGKRHSLPVEFLNNCAQINLAEIKGQRLATSLLLFNTGTVVQIGDLNGGDIGGFGSFYDEKSKQTIFNLQLSPKKGVTLVFVFDSPKESKPQTLAWPKTNPIDLR